MEGKDIFILDTKDLSFVIILKYNLTSYSHLDYNNTKEQNI